MTPAANAGGNQDLTSTRKGAQNSGSGKPAKKHNSHNRKSNKNSGANKNPARQKTAYFQALRYRSNFSYQSSSQSLTLG